ncbi:MAG: helix-turn-helix domain-containing protein [Candidatus Methanomethylophilaceae archaeon]|nr:helix-turn-helix domain-containing protein [Candidatus Methanomethylophilaceae archaeon]
MDLKDILSNPVRLRIVQYIQINGEATTKQLSDSMDDVPAPTIYRHVNALLSEGILRVKEERKIRGTTERTLAIDEEGWASKMPEDFSDVAYLFLMSLYGNFREYSARGGCDPLADMLSLRTIIIRLSDERFAQFFDDYRQLLEKYQKLEDGGKQRSISIISAPIIEEVKE